MCHVFQRNKCKVREQTALHGKHFCSIHWHKCTRQLTSSETRQKKPTLICTGGIGGTRGLSSNEVMTKKRSPAHFCMTHMWADSLFFWSIYRDWNMRRVFNWIESRQTVSICRYMMNYYSFFFPQRSLCLKFWCSLNWFHSDKLSSDLSVQTQPSWHLCVVAVVMSGSSVVGHHLWWRLTLCWLHR